MKRKRITFLYINGDHHIYHTALTAMELSILQNHYEVTLLFSTDSHKNILSGVMNQYPNHRCTLMRLSPTSKYKYFNYKKKAYPHPPSMFKKALPIIRESVSVVATSHPTISFAKKHGVQSRIYIYQFHGCGDRKYSFDPALSEYDFLLVPGELYKQRLQDENVTDSKKIKIIGYPKFDLQLDSDVELFNNSCPTVFYNPHWDKKLSSFPLWGRKVIEYFSSQDTYNLIFAPHILLSHWYHINQYDLNFSEFNKSPNILIDLYSQRSINMTYIKQADIYMGDVSSQVYEWIGWKPRPCIFLNSNGIVWENDPDYRFWHNGLVINSLEEIGTALEKLNNDNPFQDYQIKHIKKYLDIIDKKSSVRAAENIYSIIKNK